MKISGVIIQNKNISENSDGEFRSKYKGKEIDISSNHGYGKPKHDHLIRFIIYVRDIKTGMADVDTYQDCHTIKDAIRYALEGACLL